MPKTKSITVSLTDGAGIAIRGVAARLKLHGKAGACFEAKCEADGKVTFEVPNKSKKARFEISPIAGHWSIGRDIDLASTSTFEFQARKLTLPLDGLGWWHKKVGFRESDAAGGKGVRIGIVDTGCGPHPALAHIRSLGAFIEGKRLSGIDDDANHGTHVCGIVGARLNRRPGFVGIAPAAEIVFARVFQPGVTINQADIANAIDALVQENVHLINLSLGSPSFSQAINDSIENAWLNGAVCFAAAGNLGGEVLWPARHERVISVTALGSLGEAPAETLSHLLLNGCSSPDQMFGLVIPEFCCRGPQVTCCAPGVGIISTVRGDSDQNSGWGDLSGTSMACPLAMGVIAVLLGKNSNLRGMHPDEARSHEIAELLSAQCVPLDLDADLQGNGLPVLDLGSIQA